MNRLQKILIALLTLSLAANLFAVGHWLGEERQERRYAERRAADLLREPSSATLRGLASQLSEQEKARVSEGLKELRRQQRENFRNLRAQASSIAEQLRADEINVTALEQSYAQMRELNTAVRGAFQSHFVEVMANVDADRRNAFLDQIAALHERERAQRECRRAQQPLRDERPAEAPQPR